jgi:SAM-dependent methyltransferase
MDWYENWFGSPFYRILYENRDGQEAYEFIETLLCYLKPPAESSMLDIACGEGRYAIQLADKGFDVTGIDISHASIEAAKAHEQDNLHFFVQDMRMPFYVNYFDYSFNFFTSFGYFEYSRNHRLAAKSFAAGLKRGGTLVIDYLNGNFITNGLVPHSTVVRGSYKFNISKRLEHKHVVKDISFVDADGKQRAYTETVAIFSLHDFIKMFGDAGMELVATFGDYKLNPYDESGSPRMVMIFKKK